MIVGHIGSPKADMNTRVVSPGLAKMLYLAALHLLLLAIVGVVALRDRPAPQDAFRRQMLGHLARLDRNIGEGAALFLGSSNIQGLHVADVAPNAANLGLGNEQIHELHQRIGTYTALDRARLVVLATGYNDLRVRPPHVALTAYRDLLARLPASLPLVVNGVQPGAANPLPDATQAFNAGLRALCAQRPPCAYVDLAAIVGPSYEADGIHLNADAYAAWKPALRLAIATLPTPRGGG